MLNAALAACAEQNGVTVQWDYSASRQKRGTVGRAGTVSGPAASTPSLFDGCPAAAAALVACRAISHSNLSCGKRR